MCGIAGKIYLNSGQVSESELQVMSKTIAHRGPDDEGFFISHDKKIGLVNRRLAIIDLTTKGHQPMSYKNRYRITFNGEIYNFLEQREKLEKWGYRFNSGTDTEVILALYDKYGLTCLKYLRGMFAFAIYDIKENILFLARDRLGKKPLKYFYDKGVFIFASELKALLTQKEIKTIPDNLAIHNYLTYGYVPSSFTGFEDIYKLEPGHYILIDIEKNIFKKDRYWHLDFNKKLDLSEKEWCEKILSKLEESTRIRMVADVPIGAFLSGGVDSSSIVAIIARLSKKPVNTFTIGFKDQLDDERPYASHIAKLYHTNHNTLIAEPESIEELLPKLVYQYEEPYADASAVITYMISKLARNEVTVVLTGDGGDENFAGYDNRMKRLQRDVKIDRFQIVLQPFGLPISSYLAQKTDNTFWKRTNKFLKKAMLDLSHRYVSYNSIFANDEKNALYLNEFKKIATEFDSLKIAKEKFAESKATDSRDRALYFDLTNWLPDSQLTKVDIASMAASLEVRSPFLDHNMVELAAKIPFDLKVKGGEYKYILKKAVEKIVPKENLYRKKMGFTLPLHKWFKGSLNAYARSKLLTKKAVVREILKEGIIKEMLEKHTERKDFGPKLWSLLTLELWFGRYFK